MAIIKSNKASSVDNKRDLLTRWVYTILIVIMALLVLAGIFTATYDVVDGHIVTAIPPTQPPTQLPHYFEVKVKVIQEPQVVGSDFAGFNTWLGVEIVEPVRSLEKGEKYNLILGFEARRNVTLNSTLLIRKCWDVDAYSGELLCLFEYEVLENNPTPISP